MADQGKEYIKRKAQGNFIQNKHYTPYNLCISPTGKWFIGMYELYHENGHPEMY